MSDLLDFDYIDHQQTLDNMTDNIFANEWMPSWEEKSAAAATYNHYTPSRQLTDDEMLELCMSGIANVEDFIRSKPSTMFTSDNDLDIGGDQDVAVGANGVDTEAEDVLAAIASYNNGAVYDQLATGSIPAQDGNAATDGPTLDTEANDVFPPAAPFASADAHYGYGYTPTVDPFASDFNPLLDEVFASMNAEPSHSGVEENTSPSTSPTSIAAQDNVTVTVASSELDANGATTSTEPSNDPQISLDSENAPQAAHFSEDDLFGGLSDFPDFPEFDDVAISPTTASHKSHHSTSAAVDRAEEHFAAQEAASTPTTNTETSASDTDSIPTSSPVDGSISQDHKLERSTSSPGTPPASAITPPTADTVSSTSTIATVTSTSPEVSAASSNTSPTSTQSASFSNKYVSPFVSDEDDLFPPMKSFEDFLSSNSSPASNVTATPPAKPAAQNVVDLTADTPKTAHFPTTAPRYHAPTHAQPGYTPAMPAQPAYFSPMPTQSAYTATMPTQQYHPASPYVNAAPAAPYQPQKQIWEMSDAEIAAWLATAGVPPIPAPTPAATMPGLESPHYASTELPQAPYTSPMPRKRKASTALPPPPQPKRARVNSPRPVMQPKTRAPANGIPANYSWLSTPAGPTAGPTYYTAPSAAAAAVPAPPSAMGSDPAPLLAFTINGKVQGCTRVSDEQWAKMYDSAVLNGGKVRMREGRWANLWVTGRRKVVDGVERGVVAVVME